MSVPPSTEFMVSMMSVSRNKMFKDQQFLFSSNPSSFQVNVGTT